jgi:hypothetical protein
LVKNRQTQGPKESQCHPGFDRGAREIDFVIGRVKLAIVAHDFGHGVNVGEIAHEVSLGAKNWPDVQTELGEFGLQGVAKASGVCDQHIT